MVDDFSRYGLYHACGRMWETTWLRLEDAVEEKRRQVDPNWRVAVVTVMMVEDPIVDTFPVRCWQCSGVFRSPSPYYDPDSPGNVLCPKCRKGVEG
jgi:hypothetical protein